MSTHTFDLARPDYSTLDPGIRDLVKHLNDCGYETTDSGDGVTKPAGPDVMPFRHIAIHVMGRDESAGARALSLEHECWNVKAIIDEFHRERGVDRKWMVEVSYSTAGRSWTILASEYDAAALAEIGVSES